MNTALQCLSNCYELSLYFLNNKFKDYINTENPLGQKGLVAFHYSKVIRELWFGIKKSHFPVEFKKMISKLHLNVRYILYYFY